MIWIRSDATRREASRPALVRRQLICSLGQAVTTRLSAFELSLDRRSELPRLAHFAGRGSDRPKGRTDLIWEMIGPPSS